MANPEAGLTALEFADKSASELGRAIVSAGSAVIHLLSSAKDIVTNRDALKIHPLTTSPQIAPSSPSMPIPEDPNRRAVVVVLDRDDLIAARYDPEASDTLLDKEIAVAEYPPPDQDPVAKLLTEQRVFRPGATLVQSPFDVNTYVSASDAAETFAQDKYAIFLEVCQALGATSASVKRVDAESAKGKASAEVKGESPVVSGEVSAVRETVEKLSRELRWDRTFPGGAPDVDAAEAILRRHHLWSDRRLRSLIRSRSNTNNSLKEDTLTINLTKETQAKLDVAARVRLPVKKASAKVSTSKHERVSVEITFHVQF